MKKTIANFFIACSVAGIVACGGSKQSTDSATDRSRTHKPNTSTIMDSGAQSTPPTLLDSTNQ